MNPLPQTSNRKETLLSGIQYIAHIWFLGVKLSVKALIGVIVTCVMLAVPSITLNILAWIFQPDAAARNTIMGLISLPTFVIFFPIAVYVGGSTVGFCSRITSATFAGKRV